ncbi:unnamed protein product [Caenorhabditis sp. 36 PRJEB53466]|nr:unnamed protein product [Caenorhabditis sp. 36 PRJEB53466]
MTDDICSKVHRHVRLHPGAPGSRPHGNPSLTELFEYSRYRVTLNCSVFDTVPAKQFPVVFCEAMMSWHRYLLIVLCLIASLDSRKLTNEENEKRLEQCGKVHRPKVFNGREADTEEAPWSVQVSTPNGSCTGTLLSPRHLISTSHCIAKHDESVKKWMNITLKKTYFDRSTCTSHGNLVINEVLASKVTVYRNKTLVGRAKFYADDFMVVELADDVEYSPILQPACLARDITDNKAGTVLDFFGFGQNPNPNENTTSSTGGVLRHEKVKVREMNPKGTSKRMDSRLFYTRSVTETSIVCPGDSGGGAVRKIDGRITVVGALMRTSCQYMNRGKDALEVHASAGYYAEDICKYTGICTPPREQTSSGISASGTHMSGSLWIGLEQTPACIGQRLTVTCNQNNSESL